MKIIDYACAFFFLLSLNFFLIHSLPGDPVAALYGDEALLGMSEMEKVGLIKEMGLDKPIYIQWLLYIQRLIRLDLGFSYMLNEPVTKVLISFAPWTLLLLGTSLLIALPCGYFLGIEAGWRHNKKCDYFLSGCMMACNCFPPFVLAMFFLMFFGFYLDCLPLSGITIPFSTLTGWAYGKDVVVHLVLPAVSLACHEIASVYFLCRGTSLTILNRPFIFVATAKGAPEHVIKKKYIGYNILAPTLPRVGVMVANAVTGALFVEVVFAYPGLGNLAYEAILSHDYPIIQGVFLFIAVIVFIINCGIDCLVTLLTGRL